MDDFRKFSFRKRKIFEIEISRESIESFPNSITQALKRSLRADSLISLTFFFPLGSECGIKTNVSGCFPFRLKLLLYWIGANDAETEKDAEEFQTRRHMRHVKIRNNGNCVAAESEKSLVK